MSSGTDILGHGNIIRYLVDVLQVPDDAEKPPRALGSILGEESVTELGRQQLDLQINPIMSDVDIGKVRDPEKRSFREVPPPEIRATSDVSYEEDIPKEYQRIVKTYFKEITKS